MLSDCQTDYLNAMSELKASIRSIDLFFLKTTLLSALCGAYPNSPALWSWGVMEWDNAKPLLENSTIITPKEMSQLCCVGEQELSTFAITCQGSIFMVLTVNGILLLDGDADNPRSGVSDRFMAYQDIREIREDETGLSIVCGNARERFSLARTDANSYILSCITGALCSIKRNDRIARTQTVRSVLTEYLDCICIDQRHRRAYLCGRDEETLYSKKLTAALKTYASQVKPDEVVGFIDDSVFGSGRSGILFGKDGLAFTSAWERGYLPYREIEGMDVSSKGNKITFFASSSVKGKKGGGLSIISSSYDFNALKKCVEEIKHTAISSQVKRREMR